MSKGFVPNFAVKDNDGTIQKIVSLVEGGNTPTASMLLNSLGDPELVEGTTTALYDRLKELQLEEAASHSTTPMGSST